MRKESVARSRHHGLGFLRQRLQGHEDAAARSQVRGAWIERPTLFAFAGGLIEQTGVPQHISVHKVRGSAVGPLTEKPSNVIIGTIQIALFTLYIDEVAGGVDALGIQSNSSA